MDIARADALAREIDERILELPEGCDPARLFGVRARGDRFVLVPFWSGVAREMPRGLVPPDGCCAIALETGGWVAPMDDDLVRASQHPQRRRMHHTCVVYGDGIDVSVLRCDGEPVQVLRDGVGIVLELLLCCWARNRRAG